MLLMGAISRRDGLIAIVQKDEGLRADHAYDVTVLLCRRLSVRMLVYVWVVRG